MDHSDWTMGWDAAQADTRSGEASAGPLHSPKVSDSATKPDELPDCGEQKSGKKMADRRDEIVKIAAQLFAHRGFEATTIREIAKAADILSGSLYHHFDTKEDILREAVTSAITELLRQTIAISESSENPEAKLIAFVELELGEQIKNYHAHAVLYNERRLFRTRVEFEQVYQAKREIYRVWFAVLEEGMSQGLFDSKLDRYQTIRTIIRMLNSAAEWFASGEETLAGIVKNYSLAEVQDFYLRFILGAVRTAERVAEPIGRNSATRLLTDSSDKSP